MKDVYARTLIDDEGQTISRDMARSRTPATWRRPTTRRHRETWSSDELAFLRREWGEVSLRRLAYALRRTPVAIISCAHKRLRLPDPNRGRDTVNQLARSSGYGARTIRLAAKILGIKIRSSKRSYHSNKCLSLLSPPNRSAIDFDDANAIFAFLASKPDGKALRPPGSTTRGTWGEGTKPEACTRCTTKDRPHIARGMCRRCYTRWQYARKAA